MVAAGAAAPAAELMRRAAGAWGLGGGSGGGGWRFVLKQRLWTLAVALGRFQAGWATRHSANQLASDVGRLGGWMPLPAAAAAARLLAVCGWAVLRHLLPWQAGRAA